MSRLCRAAGTAYGGTNAGDEGRRREDQRARSSAAFRSIAEASNCQRWGGDCSARAKDRLEFELSRLVCAGVLTLAEAQRSIAYDWEAAYSDYVDPAGCEGGPLPPGAGRAIP